MTKSGHIKLIYQNPDMRWAEVSTELNPVGYLDGLLTHAAMAPAEGKITKPPGAKPGIHLLEAHSYSEN